MRLNYDTPFAGPALVSSMAGGLKGSEILKIAGEVRAMKAAGRDLLDLTVGDFAADQFRIPAELAAGIAQALEKGETNYPPSNGMQALREAVVRLYARELGLEVPVEAVVIAGGARPIIYGTYRALIDPGDRVLFPAPSWNNNHYVHLLGAEGVPIVVGPESRFLPTPELLAPHLEGARLLSLCSPQNPTGTAFAKESLQSICELVLAENRRRGPGGRPLYVMFDQVYWMLTFGDTQHFTPPGLVAEMAPYTIFVDGVSKGLAATGLRVGFGVGPPEVIKRMSDIIGHMGAWAPRAEQVATAQFLDNVPALTAYRAKLREGVQTRLQMLYAGIEALKAKGYPIEAIPPMGAIYLTIRLAAHGKRPNFGDPLKTNDQVRRFVLDHAGFALVPFQAFAFPGETGWFRASVGAVGPTDIERGLVRLEAALKMLR